MDLIIKICKDISFPIDRENIIQKYLIPLLIENPEKLLEISEIDTDLLSDIFNILEEKDVKILHQYIQNIVGEIEIEDFVEIKWKIGECYQCKKKNSLTKYKKLHHDECLYTDSSTLKGCGNLFCENCLFQICSDLDEETDCPAIRCQSCCSY